MEWYYVCWPWLTYKRVARVCQHQLSFLYISWDSLLQDPASVGQFRIPCKRLPFPPFIEPTGYINSQRRGFLTAKDRAKFFFGWVNVPNPVMWSETVSLRTTLVWDQKIGLGLGLARCGLGLVYYGLGLGLAGLVLCCETRSCHARRHNDLEGHSNVSSTIL